VTVFIGKRAAMPARRIFAAAMRATVEAAYNIARFTAEDDAPAWPRPSCWSATRAIWTCSPVDHRCRRRVDIARRAEARVRGLAEDPQQRRRERVGAAFAVRAGHVARLLGGYPYSRHYIACAPIAGSGGGMQRDDWYSSKRAPERWLRRKPSAATRPSALARLNARKLTRASARCCSRRRWRPAWAPSCRRCRRRAVSQVDVPVDTLGKPVFAPHIQVVERPHVPRAMGSAPFDEEGVRTHARDVVRTAWCRAISCRPTARKLGMQTTGNAGGSHNLTLTSSQTQRATISTGC
jgi:PmbA protein